MWLPCQLFRFLEMVKNYIAIVLPTMTFAEKVYFEGI